MKKKIFIVVFAAIVIAAILVGAVYAALQGKTATPVDNKMSAATDLTAKVTETFDDELKEDVSVDVGNPGYSVYVRANIVVTWKNANGDVYAKLPVEGTDYTLSLNTAAPTAQKLWFKGQDGFYYYTSPVVSGKTEVLINSCSLKDGVVPPEGYQLSVEVVAQTVQYKGTTDTGEIPAVKDAWGVTLSEGPVTAGGETGNTGVIIITGPVAATSGTDNEPFQSSPGDMG